MNWIFMADCVATMVIALIHLAIYRDLDKYMEQRSPRWLRELTSLVGVCILLFFIRGRLFYMEYFMLMFLGEMFFIKIFYKSEYRVSLFILSYLALHLLAIKGILISISALVGYYSLGELLMSHQFRLFSTAICFVVTYMLSALLEKTALNRNLEYLRMDPYAYRICLKETVALWVLLLLSTGIYYIDTVAHRRTRLFVLLLSVTVLMVYHVFIGYVVRERMLTAANKEKEVLLEEQLRKQLNSYQAQLEFVNKFRKFKHDYKNQLKGLAYILDSGDPQKARDYLSMMTQEYETSIAGYTQYSNNELLDAILQDAARQCEQHGIEFQAKVKIDDNFYLSDIDLCTVFSNILNNAIEAVRKVPVSEQPRIELSSSKQSIWSAVICKNTYNGVLNQAGDEIQTTKADSFFHGIGLKKIKDRVEAAGGIVNISTTDTVFTIMVCMNKQGGKVC